MVRILRPGSPLKAQLELQVDAETGSTLVVKRYALEHICDSPEAFHQTYLGLPENPWSELALAQQFAAPPPGLVCPCATPYRGVFLDPSGDVLILSDYLPLGDLFDFVGSQGEPGAAREAAIRPVLRAMLVTVSAMHSIGVAHCDLSVEHMLLKQRPQPESSLAVVLIDFATALCGKNARAAQGIRGKPQYQAPEIHKGTYDAYAADLFACGVVAFALALGSYPWTSTAPGTNKNFETFRQHGLRGFLQRWPVGRPGAEHRYAADVLSPGLVRAVAALLHLDPRKRRACHLHLDPRKKGLRDVEAAPGHQWSLRRH